MRSWIGVLALSGWVGFATAGGCSGDDTGATPSGATVTVGSGVGGGSYFGCNGAGPDGICNLRGKNPESCQCPDCEPSATCRGVCPDDGQCSYDPDTPTPTHDEDCTCDDCYGQVASCPPAPVGCPNDNNEECTANEDCTCPDCSGTPRCTDHCTNNGSCVPYLEGCSCADCAGQVEDCGGNPTTSSSTTTGVGGAGGVGGVGVGGASAGGAGGA